MRFLMVLGVILLMAGSVSCDSGKLDVGAVADKRFETVRDTDTPCDVSHLAASFGTVEAWKARAAELREQVLASAGLMPMPKKTPLRAKVFGRIDRGDYTIEKVHFESYPGLYVAGNLYRPKGKGPFPTVLNPHGHWANGRFENTDICSVPGRCINLAKQGYVAFSYDMIGVGDSLQLLKPGDKYHTLNGFGGRRDKL